MKKYISLFSFIALFFVGMQFSSAQSADRQQSAEARAKQKTYQIHELVTLTGEQQSDVYKVLVDAEQNLGELNKRELTDSFRQDGILTINERVEKSLKNILTPTQYETYESSLNVSNKK
ncbi:hypothetical protein ACW5R3_11525 [Bizionia sp. KMM 8389]